MSNEGVEPGQVWEIKSGRTWEAPKRSEHLLLILITELDGGPWGTCVGLALNTGQVVSLFQTTIGMLVAEGNARRIV